MTKELKLRILKAYLFYVIVDCRLKFCVQRGFKDIQQEVKREGKLLFIKKCFLQLSKEIKKGELKERKMYQKGVANGSQEGK